MHRRTVRGDYANVGLRLMVDQAERYTTTVYPRAVKKPCAEGEIEALRERLCAFAEQGNATPQATACTRWVLDEQLGPQAAQAFRHQYLHLSSQEGSFVHYPRVVNKNRLERERVAA